MLVKTWFGNFTLDEDKIIDAELFKKDIDSLIKQNEEPLLLSGRVAGMELQDLAVKYGFVRSKDEYNSLLHLLSIALAKKQIVQAVTPERHIIASVEAVDDLDESCNILSERLREWYMLNFNEIPLKGEELANNIIEMENADENIRQMQSLASSLLKLYDTRNSIEEHLKESMPKIAPNLTNIAGYILGARLLSIAGSLERLASMPSSTIQVIGADNALFKHLKGKAPSPKHGLIFRHPLVNTAPKRLRGRVARALAAKISLAARCDCYSGELKDDLLVELKTKIEYIKKRAEKQKS